MSKTIITGGNRGIGLAIAKEMVSLGHEVVLVVRDKNKGAAAIEEIKATTGKDHLSLIEGDLSSIEKCRKLTREIEQNHGDVSILINNAGVWMTKNQLNEDGLEMSFMVNYLAPYILCKNLRGLLEKNQPSRIVNVNAGLYVKGKWSAEKTPYGLDFSPIKTYTNSKLCNAMFTLDFATELAGSGVTINAVHPGVINTGLGDSPRLLSKLIGLVKRFWKPPEYGAIAPVWLATSEEIEGVKGMYFNEKEKMEYAPQALEEDLRRTLREVTERLLR